MLSVHHRRDHRRGATLIGDSAHLMTPFAGEGVNVAMTDAMNLAEAIVKNAQPDELDANIKAFEEKMFVRAGRLQALTKANTDDLYSTEPFHTWVLRFAQRMALEASGEAYFQNALREVKQMLTATSWTIWSHTLLRVSNCPFALVDI